MTGSLRDALSRLKFKIISMDTFYCIYIFNINKQIPC